MRIKKDFEGARIAVVAADDPSDVRLTVPADGKNPRFRQWFSFWARGVRGKACSYRVMNAGACTWGRAFARYQVAASYDDVVWFRVPTTFDGEVLTFAHTPASERVHYAYFAPYSSERLGELLDRADSAGFSVEPLGDSGAGAAMKVLFAGNDEGDAPRVWVIAQQHPGEPMAGWFMEGLIERLLSGDEASSGLLRSARLCLVPCMNPDGVAMGNHRTNAAGLDLNRQWMVPDPKAPEVAWVRDRMRETGVDFFLDVHGDEVLPYVFAQGTEGNPGRTSRIEELEERFAEAMLEASPEFQTEHSYPRDMPGEANLRIAANWVGETFDCLSMTLEMPFIDNANAPDPERGWSPERSKTLGSSLVDALRACAAELRAGPTSDED